ncbi:Serpin domain-containing protein [Aspergillus carlsbadensis]|nr:Serpin domain-containing protein [Aspergillus carlsbadensis]
MSLRNTETRAVVDKVNELGWNTVTQLCSNGVPLDGTAVSALSITTALAMLAGGAQGTHREELCKSLGLQSPSAITTVLPKVFKTLESEAIRFNSANALFTTKSTEVFPDYIRYLEQLDAYIDSNSTILADEVHRINGWIEEQTDGLIKNMLTRGNLALSHMVLINALVFKATWETAFDPKHTIKDHVFDTTKRVAMMFRHREFVLVSGRPDYTAVRLPYVSTPPSEWSFVAYLPKKDKSVQDILPQIREYNKNRFQKLKIGKLGLPKFNLQTKDSIKPLLEELGYPLAGDFPAMAAGGSLVDQIVHSVTIILDEQGTEAAAATAVMMLRGGGPPRPPPDIIFDRPFAFSIVAEELGVALFTGVFSVS